MVRFELADHCKPKKVDATASSYSSNTQITVDVSHGYIKGDRAKFKTSGGAVFEEYTVLSVIDKYSFVIDMPTYSGTGEACIPLVRDAQPLGYSDTTYITELEENQAFYRTKLNGRLTFTNGDFEWLKDRLFGCCSVHLRVYDCDKVKYIGLIDRKGVWDECRCTFAADVRPYDKYECFLSENKVNWLACGDAVQAGYNWTPNWEFAIVDNASILPSPGPQFPDINIGIGSKWSPIFALPTTNGNNTNNTTLHARSYVYRPCCDTASQGRLVSAGWVKTGDCVNGYQKFTIPVSSEMGLSGVELVAEVSDYVIFSHTCTHPTGTWLALNSGGSSDSHLYRGCWYINNNFFKNILTLNNGRHLKDVLECFLCGGVSEVVSDFFEINPPGDAPNYVTNINYVTGGTNQLVDLLIFPTSAVAERFANFDSTFTPTIGAVSEKTFVEFMEQLRVMFDVYWFIDSRCRLRIEHRSYFKNVFLLELSDKKYCAPYEYDIRKTKKETWSYDGSIATDWNPNTIEYKRDCLQEESGHVADCTITDLIYIRHKYPELRDSEGIVIVAGLDLNGGLYSIRKEFTEITNIEHPNAHLSWANLLPRYHRENRAATYACLNGCDVIFPHSKERIMEITYQGCCVDLPERLLQVNTPLGSGDLLSITEFNGKNYYKIKVRV